MGSGCRAPGLSPPAGVPAPSPPAPPRPPAPPAPGPFGRAPPGPHRTAAGGAAPLPVPGHAPAHAPRTPRPAGPAAGRSAPPGPPRRRHPAAPRPPPARHPAQQPLGLRRAQPVVRVLAQQPLDHRPQRPRAARRRKRVVHRRAERRQGRLPAERGAPLHRGEEQYAQRPEVRGRAGVALQRPFRGQVLRRADHLTGVRQLLPALHQGAAEVGEDHPSVVGEQDVGRLHVPVQHARAVCRPQCREHLGAHRRGPLRRQRAPRLQHVLEGRPADQLHHDPRPPVLTDHVEHLGHARVLDPPGRPRLPLQPCVEPGHVLLGQAEGHTHLLHGHLAAQRLVPRPPHRPHPAPAQLPEEPVPPGQQPAARARSRTVSLAARSARPARRTRRVHEPSVGERHFSHKYPVRAYPERRRAGDSTAPGPPPGGAPGRSRGPRPASHSVTAGCCDMSRTGVGTRQQPCGQGRSRARDTGVDPRDDRVALPGAGCPRTGGE
ncbi:hypothetical protein SDIAM103S_00992 [Streptomyces diastaticus subsp. diastaticus]